VAIVIQRVRGVLARLRKNARERKRIDAMRIHWERRNTLIVLKQLQLLVVIAKEKTVRKELEDIHLEWREKKDSQERNRDGEAILAILRIASVAGHAAATSVMGAGGSMEQGIKAAADAADKAGASREEAAYVAGEVAAVAVLESGGETEEAVEAAAAFAQEAGGSLSVQGAAAGVAIERAGGSAFEAAEAAAEVARMAGASSREVQAIASRAAAAARLALGGSQQEAAGVAHQVGVKEGASEEEAAVMAREAVAGRLPRLEGPDAGGEDDTRTVAHDKLRLALIKMMKGDVGRMVHMWKIATRQQLAVERAEAARIERELETKAQQAGIDTLKQVAVQLMKGDVGRMVHMWKIASRQQLAVERAEAARIERELETQTRAREQHLYMACTMLRRVFGRAVKGVVAMRVHEWRGKMDQEDIASRAAIEEELAKRRMRSQVQLTAFRRMKQVLGTLTRGEVVLLLATWASLTKDAIYERRRQAEVDDKVQQLNEHMSQMMAQMHEQSRKSGLRLLKQTLVRMHKGKMGGRLQVWRGEMKREAVAQERLERQRRGLEIMLTHRMRGEAGMRLVVWRQSSRNDFERKQQEAAANAAAEDKHQRDLESKFGFGMLLMKQYLVRELRGTTAMRLELWRQSRREDVARQKASLLHAIEKMRLNRLRLALRVWRHANNRHVVRALINRRCVSKWGKRHKRQAWHLLLHSRDEGRLVHYSLKAWRRGAVSIAWRRWLFEYQRKARRQVLLTAGLRRVQRRISRLRKTTSFHRWRHWSGEQVPEHITLRLVRQQRLLRPFLHWHRMAGVLVDQIGMRKLRPIHSFQGRLWRVWRGKARDYSHNQFVAWKVMQRLRHRSIYLGIAHWRRLVERTAGRVRRLMDRMKRRRVQSWRIYGAALGRAHTPHPAGVSCIHATLRKKEQGRLWLLMLQASVREWHSSNATARQLSTAYHRWHRCHARRRRRKAGLDRAEKHFASRPVKPTTVEEAIETIADVGVHELPPKLVAHFRRKEKLGKSLERWRGRRVTRLEWEERGLKEIIDRTMKRPVSKPPPGSPAWRDSLLAKGEEERRVKEAREVMYNRQLERAKKARKKNEKAKQDQATRQEKEEALERALEQSKKREEEQARRERNAAQSRQGELEWREEELERRDKEVKQREEEATQRREEEAKRSKKRLQAAEEEAAKANTELVALRAAFAAAPRPPPTPAAMRMPTIVPGFGLIDGSLTHLEVEIASGAAQSQEADHRQADMQARMDELERKAVLAEFNRERVTAAIRGHELTFGYVDQNKRAEIKSRLPWWEKNWGGEQPQQGSGQENRRDQIDAIFEDLDRNGDGVLDRSEWRSAANGAH